MRNIRSTPVDIACFSLVLGLLAGLAHAAVWLARLGRGEFTWMPRATPWMSPLAYAPWFLVVGVVLAVLCWRWPAAWTGRRLLAAPVVLFVWALVLHAKFLHPLAVLVLTLGIAIVLLRLIAPLQHLVLARTRGTLAAMLLLVLAIGVGQQAVRTIVERRSLAAIAPAPASSPNVVLLILDTVRARNLSLYGYHRETTPTLDRLASQSVVFDRAFAPSSWTLSSHASMFTGRDPFAIDAGWEVPLGTRVPLLAEHFRDAGYATGGFVANLLYTQYESGIARGFQHYEDHHASARQIALTSNFMQLPIVHDLLVSRSLSAAWTVLRQLNFRPRRSTYKSRKWSPEVVGDFLDWESRTDRPFFAFLNLFDAHGPYSVAEPWGSRFAADPTAEDRYDGAIALMDAQVGVLVNALRQRGVLENTIIVVASDHGEQFGEHGLDSHGNSLYAQVTHVPLMVRLPERANAGVRVDEAVSLTDLGATLLELTRTPANDFPGTSLVALLSGADSLGVPAISEVAGTDDDTFEPTFMGPMRAIAMHRWHLIRRGDGQEQLFDLQRDPDERIDLSPNPHYAALRDSLRTFLGAMPARTTYPPRTRTADEYRQ
jgi:arylsulfatase A-like enzyme